MCFPGFEQFLTGAQIVEAPERVVTDANITTSRGMGTSIDLGLELVSLLKGQQTAESLAVSTQYA
jgi:4-methyl-5(b-hydroxyethyl)-thiazole monophosphate biosynthesis